MEEKLRYRNYIKENRTAIIGFSVLSCVVSILAVAFAYMTKFLIDSATQGKPFVIFAVVTGVLIIAEVGFKYLYSYLVNRKIYQTENAIKKQAFLSYLKKDYRDAERIEDADVLMRLTSDCRIIAEGVITYVPEFVGMLTRIVASLAILFIVDWLFASCLLGVGIIVYFATKLLRRRNKTLHKNAQQAEGEVLSFYKEGISHSFLFKLFGNGKYVNERCDEIQTKYHTARMRYASFNIFVNTGFLFFMRASYLIAIIWAVLVIVQGGSWGNLFLMVQLIAQIEGPFSSISGLIPQYYRTLGSIERIFALEGKEEATPISITEFNSPIIVDNISFSYDDGQTPLQNLSLTINPHDFIAIVGGSGCGKSTLLKCIMGMYKPSQGSVTFEGKDVSLCSTLFSYVPQGNFLIPGTIKENLCLFSPEATDDEIEKVLSLTMLTEKISSLPAGLNSSVSDFGAGLSEGEGQRLSIARALLVDRPVLVLDECTSALDEVTEKAIIENIVSLGKTVLLVSHKSGAIRYASKVFRLKKEQTEEL
ncbi:MAG: ABC transporter ATP-binding protein [Candidatus Coproplasma sp.]